MNGGGFFGALGSAIIGPVQDVATQATEAFYVLAGLELLILVGIVVLVLQGFHIL